MEGKVKGINLPSFLSNFFYVFEFRDVKIEKLFVGLRYSDKRKIEYLNILKTPHYFFALNNIDSKIKFLKNEPINYQSYIDSNQDDPRSKERFTVLIDSIKKNGYNFKESPILVFRTFKRPLPLDRWDVADGFHRLAILAALGNKSIKVAILKRKQSFFTRLKQKIKDAK